MYKYDAKVKTALKECGIPQSLSGYTYLNIAINLVIEDPSLTKLITKNLYPEVAYICKKTPAKVERGMRYAIEVGFNKIDTNLIYEIFGNGINPNTGKPTNMHFIAAIAEYVTKGNLIDDKLPYTRISEDINNKISELMTDYANLVNKAKSYGLDIKFAPDSENTLELYFHDDYPNTLLVDKDVSLARDNINKKKE